MSRTNGNVNLRTSTRPVTSDLSGSSLQRQKHQDRSRNGLRYALRNATVLASNPDCNHDSDGVRDQSARVRAVDQLDGVGSKRQGNTTSTSAGTAERAELKVTEIQAMGTESEEDVSDADSLTIRSTCIAKYLSSNNTNPYFFVAAALRHASK